MCSTDGDGRHQGVQQLQIGSWPSYRKILCAGRATDISTSGGATADFTGAGAGYIRSGIDGWSKHQEKAAPLTPQELVT